MCGYLLSAPYRERGPQPRHVPWLGIELVTFWFAARAESTELHQPGLNNIFLNNTGIKEEISRVIQIHGTKWKYNPKICSVHRKQCLEGNFSIKWKRRKMKDCPLSFHISILEKEEQFSLKEVERNTKN